MDLLTFNPWWREGRLHAALVGKKRKIFTEVLSYLDLRQILIFSGLRRVGKTTLMFQLIEELLSRGINPYHILYFSFDDEISEIKNIFDIFEKEVLKERISGVGNVYVFFDEVQKLENWPEKVKIIYDLYPNCKVFLSGSAAINIIKGTKESLAGRFFDFRIEPLSFDEHLIFKGVEIDNEREDIFEVEIKRHLNDFLKTGGFIEAMHFNDMQLKKYFKEGLLERIVYKDIPGAFSVSSPDLLNRLVRICAGRPGIYLDYKNIANDLGYDQRTIADYFSYLDHALLINKLYNYSPNLLASEKKMKRAYLSNTAFTLALSEKVELPILLEQFFVQLFKARFFSRTPQKDEVDIVLVADKRLMPVEVKIKPEIRERDIVPIIKFLKKTGSKKGCLISGGDEKTFVKNGFIVKVIPYWKYWSMQREIEM
ncbi:MAG: ATP-binding protein [Actinobacteria bacterium]|nr:ATP-binding protein [Actinomycetota bacterium]